MKRQQKHRLWIVSVGMLVFCSFLAGTSFACFQQGAGARQMAEDCCQHHCQHAMTGEVAADCCQNHRVPVSHALSLSSPVKTLALTASALPIALLSPAVLHGPDQGWAY